MIIDWEGIRFEVDDAGTTWATLADDAHNSLTLECRDGAVTFHADASPRFGASALLEITALCMILVKDAVGGATGAQQAGPILAGRSQPGDPDAYIPEQRQAADETSDIQPAARRPPRAASARAEP